MKITLRQPVLTLMAGMLFASCKSEAPRQAQAAAKKVIVKEISEVPKTLKLTYSGSIEPDNSAQIGFAVPGVVSTILAEEGQHVSAGQLLATIDNTEYANALAIANAGLEQAEDMYIRLDGLYKKGSLPEKDYIDVKTKLAQARANKSINTKRIKDSKLYAPLSGIISARMIERGSTAAPGVPAFSIIKTDKVYARLSVPESEIGAIRRGMKAKITIPTLNEAFEGEISIINPQADAVSKTYPVKVKLDNPAGLLLPGMITEATINTGKPVNIITVPASSVIRDADGITYVFVAGKQRKAIQTRVETGSVTGVTDVIITDGLSAGQKIIVAGHINLKDGAAITF